MRPRAAVSDQAKSTNMVRLLEYAYTGRIRAAAGVGSACIPGASPTYTKQERACIKSRGGAAPPPPPPPPPIRSRASRRAGCREVVVGAEVWVAKAVKVVEVRWENCQRRTRTRAARPKSQSPDLGLTSFTSQEKCFQFACECFRLKGR
jgi:hypothetical protein